MRNSLVDETFYSTSKILFCCTQGLDLYLKSALWNIGLLIQNELILAASNIMFIMKEPVKHLLHNTRVFLLVIWRHTPSLLPNF